MEPLLSFLLWPIAIGYVVASQMAHRYRQQVKRAVPASLERMAAIRSAIIATMVTIVMAMCVFAYFCIAFASDEGFLRFMDAVVIVLYLFTTMLYIRELVKLIKDDDSWFNRSWKRLKKWTKSLRFNISFGFKPKLA